MAEFLHIRCWQRAASPVVPCPVTINVEQIASVENHSKLHPDAVYFAQVSMITNQHYFVDESDYLTVLEAMEKFRAK